MSESAISGTVGQRVAKARADKGWSQAELARRLTALRGELGKGPVHQQSINQLESGEVETPRYLVELADVLHVNLGWLTGREDEVSPARPPVVDVPLISWVEAGGLVDAADPYVPGDAEDWIPVAHRHGHLIALRVKGQSMEKIAPEGSIIIVDLTDRTPVDGKHYIFRHDGRATFKTYRAGPPPRLQPQSFDPDYQPIDAGDGIEIVGRVIQKTEAI